MRGYWTEKKLFVSVVERGYIGRYILKLRLITISCAITAGMWSIGIQ